jgi:hypothetical protein
MLIRSNFIIAIQLCSTHGVQIIIGGALKIKMTHFMANFTNKRISYTKTTDPIMLYTLTNRYIQ